MEYLLYFPMNTEWELAVFMGMMASWFVADYAINQKPKRSKRTERQIFDEYGEGANMILKVVSTNRFVILPSHYQRMILQLIDNRYYGR